VVSAHDIEWSNDIVNLRQAMIDHCDDVWMSIPRKKGYLVLEASPFISRCAVLRKHLERYGCLIDSNATVDASRSAFADDFIDNIDAKRSFE
jgi:hypothetical protein